MNTTKGGAFARINSNYDSLLPAEKRIADALLASNAEISALSIGELAELSGSSKATVTRFCRRLGYDGFRDFRVSAIIDAHKGIGRQHHLPPQIAKTIGETIESICDSNAQACADTKLLLNGEALEEAASIIVQQKRVILVGEGPTAPVALDFYQKLLRVGIMSIHSTDRRIQRMHVSLTSPEDAVVAFDLAGQSKSAVGMMKTAAENGAKTVAVCNTIGSPLSKASGLNLYGPGRMGSDISGTLAPRIALMCIVDCLFYALLKQMDRDCEDSIVKTNQVILDDWI